MAEQIVAALQARVSFRSYELGFRKTKQLITGNL